MAMTPKEHQLVIQMFKQQMLMYAAIVELLKSRGVVENSADLNAFDALVSASSREFLEENTEASYRDIAAILGVTDLPPL